MSEGVSESRPRERLRRGGDPDEDGTMDAGCNSLSTLAVSPWLRRGVESERLQSRQWVWPGGERASCRRCGFVTGDRVGDMMELGGGAQWMVRGAFVELEMVVGRSGGSMWDVRLTASQLVNKTGPRDDGTTDAKEEGGRRQHQLDFRR
jgi:hypothetical protein